MQACFTRFQDLKKVYANVHAKKNQQPFIAKLIKDGQAYVALATGSAARVAARAVPECASGRMGPAHITGSRNYTEFSIIDIEHGFQYFLDGCETRAVKVTFPNATLYGCNGVCVRVCVCACN